MCGAAPIATTTAPWTTIGSSACSILRPQEIPLYVQDGLFDLGITGQDWIAETAADVEVVTTLSYARSGTGHGTEVVLAVPNEHPANSAKEIPAGTRISTEFLKLTERYFADLGIAVKVVWSYGATEAKVPEIVDAIVDVTETGNTLRAHGMKIIETLLTSEPVLIANREAMGDEFEARGHRRHPDPAAGCVASGGTGADQAQRERGSAVAGPRRRPVDEGAHGLTALRGRVRDRDGRGQARREQADPRSEGGGRDRHPGAADLQDRALTSASMPAGSVRAFMRRLPPVAALLLVVLARPAAADPGALDTSFSGNGIQTIFTGGATAQAVAIDAQDRILVAGYTFGANEDVAVTRLRPGGALDGTFSGDGRVRIDLGASDHALDIATAPGGKIVVVGQRTTLLGSSWFVLRLKSGGGRDRTFGGDGVVITDFGRRFAHANAVAVQANGKIVVGGSVSGGGHESWTIARFLSGGALDSSFGGDGRVTLSLSSTGEQIQDLVVRSSSHPGGWVRRVRLLAEVRRRQAPPRRQPGWRRSAPTVCGS